MYDMPAPQWLDVFMPGVDDVGGYSIVNDPTSATERANGTGLCSVALRCHD